MEEGNDEAFEKWLREEIPQRLEDLRKDPSLGIPIEIVFAQLEARYRARLAKEK